MRLGRALVAVVAALAGAGCGLGASLDEYTSGGAPDGGGAGVGGSGGDASVDGAKSDGTAGAGGSGGAAGDAGDDVPQGPGIVGQPCTVPDAYACAGPAQQVVAACKNGHWTYLYDCFGDKLCDSSVPANVSDRCTDPVPICTGQKPGAAVCDGATLTVCGDDLVTTTTTDCGSAKLCALHVGTQCAVCVDGQFQCSGSSLQACAADHLSFQTTATCPTLTPCNAGAGQCTAAACVAGQHRCTGDALEVCNAGQTGFDPVTTCSPGLCDAPKGVCDKCLPSTSSCADATHTQTCAADGQSQTVTACPAAKPDCTGAGVCVACTSATDCSNGGNPCLTATCSNGACGTAHVADGTACGTGATCQNGSCCTPSTCTALGKNCGTVSLGCGKTQDCGTCTSPNTCGGGGTANVCGCTPKDQATACGSHECGTALDGCGSSLSCGFCDAGYKCIAGTCEYTCFVPGTPVAMADGSSKPIERVRVGDEVLAFDAATGELRAEPVTRTFEHPPTDDGAIVVVNGAVEATPNHPFFANGRWVRADQLREGDAVLTLDATAAAPLAARPTTITSLVPAVARTPTYNLEVAGEHDYFAGGILVHNNKVPP